MSPRTKATVAYNSLVCAISPLREQIKEGRKLLESSAEIAPYMYETIRGLLNESIRAYNDCIRALGWNHKPYEEEV